MDIQHVAGICLSFLRTTSYTQSLILCVLVLSLIWAFVKVIFSWLKTLQFKKRMKIVDIPLRIQELSLKHELEGKLIIFQNSKPAAFCLGIKNPKIYLSTNLLKVMNKKEIEAIILHEKYHLTKRDIFLVFLATFAKGLFFLFPLITDIFSSFIRQKETEADRYSLSYIKDSQIVLSAFEKLLSRRSTNIPSLAYLVSFGKVDTLEHRIKILKGEKTFVLSFKITHIFLSCFSLIAVISFLFLSTKPVVAHQDVSPLVCLKGHNCHSECSS